MLHFGEIYYYYLTMGETSSTYAVFVMNYLSWCANLCVCVCVYIPVTVSLEIL